MGFIHTYNTLNNNMVYENAYYSFVDYDELIRNFDESNNSGKLPIFWKAGHHINPIYLVYENKDSKINGGNPIGLLTGNLTGKTTQYSNIEKITNMNVVFMYDSSSDDTMEQQAYIHIKSLSSFSNAIIE